MLYRGCVTFDELGQFWIAGHQEDKLSGRLTYDPMRGIGLAVVGSFDHYDDSSMCTVHGWIGHHEVSLHRAYRSGSRIPSPGVRTETYTANFMLAGHHVAADDLRFQSARVEFRHLHDWIGRSGWNELDSGPRRRTIEMSFPDSIKVRFSEGWLSLYFRDHYEIGRATRHLTVGQHPVLYLEYDTMQPLDLLRRDIGRLEALVILCTNTGSEPDRIVFHRPDVRLRMLAGEDPDYEQEIQLFAQRLNHIPLEDRKSIPPFRMLLTFEQFGGMEGVARWLDESRRFQRVLDNMISVHRREMFMENRFLNIVGAAEAFHRIANPPIPQDDFDMLYAKLIDATPEEHREWLAGKLGFALEPALRRRMLDLAKRSGEATVKLTGSNSRQRNDWAAAIADLRNWLSHVGGAGERPDGGDMRYLGDSVYCVLRICLLLEAGLDPQMLPSLRDSGAHRLPVEICNVVERVRGSLSTAPSK